MSQPAWIHRIKRGDILRSGSGLLRVVRSVSHSLIPVGCGGTRKPHFRTTVIFTIQHCSWTGRCYTVYTGNDLVQIGYRPTRGRIRLNRKIDRRIEQEFREHPRVPGLSCCDVEGIG